MPTDKNISPDLAEINRFKAQAQLSYDELEEVERRKFWRESYLVKPVEIIEGYRKIRKHNRPRFPYLSFKQKEILGMCYALRIIARSNIAPTIYKPTARETTTTSNILHSVKDLTNKGYLDVIERGAKQEFLYSLSELGFQFLNQTRFNTDFDSTEMTQLSTVNKIFTKLVGEYRQIYYLEWLTKPYFPEESSISAVAIIWESVYPFKAKESAVFELVKGGLNNQRAHEVLMVKDTYTELLGNDAFLARFPTIPNIYLVHADSPAEKPMLKLFQNGQIWAGDGQIKEWLEL